MDGIRELSLGSTARRISAFVILSVWGIAFTSMAVAQTFVTPGTNTNIIGVTPNPAHIRDLGLKQQQEPSCVVRPGNEAYIFCAYNDLRAADLPSVQGDSWMGVSMSGDAGQTWFSRLAPGFLSHPNSLGMGFAADPGVVAIPGNSPGLAVLNYIAAYRDSNVGVLAIQRWVEFPQEDQDFWKPEDGIYMVADGSEGRFIDKPSFFYLVDEIAQQGVITEQINVEGEVTPITVKTPTGTLIVVYAVFTGNGGGAKVYLRRSRDNGKTWSGSLKISEEQNEVTGVSVTAVGQKFVVVYRRKGDTNDPDSILSAFCSNDGNQKCTKGEVVFDICPFDQPASGSTFRTFSFPWTANDGNRFWAFAADRRYPNNSCTPVPGSPGLFSGKPRIVGMSSVDGKTWVGASGSESVPFDVASRNDGFQLMPVAFGTKGRIDLAWYDTFREENIGLPPGANDILVNDYLSGGTARVFRKADVFMTRLTASSACGNSPSAGCTPIVQQPVRISQYQFAVDLADPTVGAEIEAHLPNLTLYGSGTLAFNGDYISLATPGLRKIAGGKWISNSKPGGSNELPGFTNRQDLFIAWGDNRDVRADLPVLNGGAQLPYTPPLNSDANPGGPMAETNDEETDPDFKRPGDLVAEDEPDNDPVLPSDIGVCQIGFDFSRSRDSNVYSSLVRDEPSLIAPTPTKPLGTIQRMFPLVLTNIDGDNAKDFCLHITNQPLDYPSNPGIEDNGLASFYQLPAFAPFMQGNELVLLDVKAPAGSSASRAVFVTTNNAQSIVGVNAYQGMCPLTPSGPFNGPLVNSVQLGDGALFDPVFCQNNPTNQACDLVSSNETHDVSFAAPVLQTAVLQAPSFQTPSFQTPVLQTPVFQTPSFQTPSFQTPSFQTPSFQTPSFQTPSFQTPSFQTPVLQTPSFQTPSLQSGTLIGDTAATNPQQIVYQDITYPINATANVTTTYSADIALSGLDPDETAVQLIAWTPNTYATTVDCYAQPIPDQQIIAYTDLDAVSLQSVTLPTTFSSTNQNPYAGEISFFGQPDKNVAVTVRIWAVGNAKQTLFDMQSEYMACVQAGDDDCDAVGTRSLISFGASAHGCRTNDAVANTQNPGLPDCLNNGNEKIFEDRQPPIFNLAPDTIIEVEADLPGGAIVDLAGGAVTASDNGEPVGVICYEIAPNGTQNVLPELLDIGSYPILCEAGDAAGNLGSINLIVDVTDSLPPVVTLLGDPNPVVEAATVYVDPGVTATDLRGSTVIPLVAVVTGNIDTTILGLQTLTYTVTDTGGNTVVATRNVTVVDTTPPVLSGVPGDISGVEATSASGAVVTWPAPSATDSLEGDVAVLCAPTSGSVFGFGATTVNCSASDSSGNSAAQSFDVTVADTQPPTPPMLPGVPVGTNIVQEASGPIGATVTWTVVSSDVVDPTPTISCAPASGTTFAIGTTPVVCTATDDAGNTSVGGFNVIVQDTTAPVFAALPNLSAEATSAGGASVTWPAIQATDVVDGQVPAVCSPASGSQFVLGATTVNCTATDAAANGSSASFVVTVQDTTAPVVTASNINVSVTTTVVDVEVNYVAGNVMVSDAGDPNPALSCAITNPGPNVTDDGTTARITAYGSWTVSCTATDASSNSSSPATTFSINVAFPFGIELILPKGQTKGGSTIPIDWKYLDTNGNPVNSSAVTPKVTWRGKYADTDTNCSGVSTNVVVGEDAGSSSIRYTASSRTWQFSWQTPNMTGRFLLVITPPGVSVPAATACVRLR